MLRTKANSCKWTGIKTNIVRFWKSINAGYRFDLHEIVLWSDIFLFEQPIAPSGTLLEWMKLKLHRHLASHTCTYNGKHCTTHASWKECGDIHAGTARWVHHAGLLAGGFMPCNHTKQRHAWFSRCLHDHGCILYKNCSKAWPTHIIRSCHQSWRCCLIHLFFHLYPQCDSIISRDRGGEFSPCWPQGQRRRATPALINGLQPLVLSLIFCLGSFGRISLWDWRWWIKQIFQLLQALLHFDQQGVASCKLGSNFDAGRLQLYQHVTRRHGNETQTLLWTSGCYRSAHMFGSSQAMGHDCLHGNDCMWIQHYTASCMFSTPFVK